MSRQPYLSAVNERVIVFDGAFGTFVQDLDLGPDDFGGASLEGCNEYLCITRPDVIRQMHSAFLDVGVDGPNEVTTRGVGHLLDVGGQIMWMDHVVDGRGIHGDANPHFQSYSQNFFVPVKLPLLIICELFA